MIGMILLLVVWMFILSPFFRMIVKAIYAQETRDEHLEIEHRKGTRAGRLIATGVFFAIVVLNSVVIIPPATVGVQVLLGRARESVLHDGINIVSPITHVEKMSTRTISHTMSIAQGASTDSEHPQDVMILSKDNLAMSMDITSLFALRSVEARNVYLVLGADWQEKLVLPATRTALRDVGSKYVAIDLMSSARTTAEEDLKTVLQSKIDAYFLTRGLQSGIVIESTLMRNVQPPESVEQAISAKLSSEQTMQAMEYVIGKQHKEAERMTIEAQGISDAQKIIQGTLTDRYLQWKYIETLEKLVNSPNNTVIVLPFDQKLTPLLNIQSTPVQPVKK